MKALTIRNVDPALAKALERERRRRGESLNRTVLATLRKSLGVAQAETEPSNGLRTLAGTWSARDLADFREATAGFDVVDDDLWS